MRPGEAFSSSRCNWLYLQRKMACARLDSRQCLRTGDNIANSAGHHDGVKKWSKHYNLVIWGVHHTKPVPLVKPKKAADKCEIRSAIFKENEITWLRQRNKDFGNKPQVLLGVSTVKQDCVVALERPDRNLGIIECQNVKALLERFLGRFQLLREVHINRRPSENSRITRTLEPFAKASSLSCNPACWINLTQLLRVG